MEQIHAFNQVKERVTFLVDGFNLYHSIRNASRDLDGQSTKWLDIKALCSSYLHLFGKSSFLHEIYYFSALATHLEDRTRRHKKLIECYEAEGVFIELNRFKKKSMRCPSCGHRYDRREEKQTDVSIAVKLLELFVVNACDTAVLVTGDTDLAPAFRAAKRFPSKKVIFAFPYKRKNNELERLAPGSFEINKSQYARYQLPNPYILPDGKQIIKPDEW